MGFNKIKEREMGFLGEKKEKGFFFKPFYIKFNQKNEAGWGSQECPSGS